MTALRWRDVSARVGRNDLPYVLGKNWPELDAGDRAGALAAAWTMAEWPEQSMPPDLWVLFFDHVGYIVDGEPRDREQHLPEIVTLYRGATSDRRDGMSWTGSRDRAEWFARRFEGLDSTRECSVWRIETPREHVLAHFTNRGEDEYVVDTSTFDNEQYEPV